MKMAIIGGGFSGLSLAARLIFHPSKISSIVLIEKNERPGLGIAYSTPIPWHLLNVRTEQMGALDEDLEGFYHWLQTEESWRQLDPSFQNLSITPDSFLPRKLYSIYLKDLLQQLKRIAREKNKEFQIVCGEVEDLCSEEEQLHLYLNDQIKVAADIAVLAIGVATHKKLPCLDISDRYIEEIWSCDQDCLMRQVAQTDKDSTVVIIGTGLTMVDMVTSLVHLGYRGKIVAISTSGMLPEAHSSIELATIPLPKDLLEQKKLLELYRVFLKHVREGNRSDWRQLINALRPYSTLLWQQLNVADRKRFLRHLISRWNRYRHRIPPASESLLKQLLQDGRLITQTGRVSQIEFSTINGLKVHFLHEGQSQTIDAAYVYNCSGPEYALKKQPSILVQNLLKRGYIQEDELGIGIKVNQRLQAKGLITERLYVMGALLFGELFESNAVRELRAQAKLIADNLI